MNIFFTCFFIGISLSMDAFSLSLLYGTYGLSYKSEIVLSLVVAVFHFFMPLIGVFFGDIMMRYFVINANLLVGVIFFVIGVEMIISIKDESDIRLFSSFFWYLVFGFTVSIDSLTTGIGLSVITCEYFMASFIFMVLSGSFTYLGLRLGSKINSVFGKYATLLGGVMMVVLGGIYILNFFG